MFDYDPDSVEKAIKLTARLYGVEVSVVRQIFSDAKPGADLYLKSKATGLWHWWNDHDGSHRLYGTLQVPKKIPRLSINSDGTTHFQADWVEEDWEKELNVFIERYKQDSKLGFDSSNEFASWDQAFYEKTGRCV